MKRVIRKGTAIEEVWMNRLGRPVLVAASKPEIFWVVKKVLRQKKYQRLGAL